MYTGMHKDKERGRAINTQRTHQEEDRGETKKGGAGHVERKEKTKENIYPPPNYYDFLIVLMENVF